MSFSKFQISNYSQIAQKLNNEGAYYRLSQKAIGEACSVPVQLSSFEDMRASLSIQNAVDSYDIDAFYVEQPNSYLIRDCYVRTQYGAITVDDYVTRESLFHFPWHLYPQFRIDEFQSDNFNCVLPNSPPDIELSSGFSVCSGINENYYHWLILFLGRLNRECIELWADETNCRPSLIFPRFRNSLQRDSAVILAEYFNLPLISLSGQVAIQTKNLVVSEPMRSGGLHPHPIIRESLDVLKKHFYKVGDYPQKIYISRLDSNNRKLLNESLIEDMFRERGYEILTLSKLTLSDQINYFSHAKKIVGAHGAGLTNLCFSEPGAQILEIHMPNYQNWCYRRLAALFCLNYQHIFGVLKAEAPQIHNCKFEVDPVKVLLCFEYDF